MGSGGASGGFNTTTKLVDAATNGTQRTFTKTIMDNSIEDAYRAGGSPTILMLSPYLKRVVFWLHGGLCRCAVPQRSQRAVNSASSPRRTSISPTLA